LTKPCFKAGAHAPAFSFVRGRLPRYTICIILLRHQTLESAWKQKNNIEYIPEFEKSFRHPRNWGAWLGVYAFAGIALLPARPRSFLGKLAVLPGGWVKAPAAARRSTSTVS
jgi:hypothetical protein